MNAHREKILPLGIIIINLFLINFDTYAHTSSKRGHAHVKALAPHLESSTASKISSWSLSGAIAAKSNRKAWSASLNWTQHGPSAYHIRLIGPMGGGTMIIERRGNTVVYRHGTKALTAQNAEQLLQKQTGVRLPVDSLYYWVRGLAAPGAVQVANHDQNHHLTLLRQKGYVVQYSGYTSVGSADLPSKIHLDGNGTSIKLAIKHWNI